MASCRTPGATCITRLPTNLNGNTSSVLGQAVGLWQLVLDGLAKPARDLGITDLEGFAELKSRLDSTFGLALAFGFSKTGEPCLHEFKVDDKHDGMLGVFGEMKHTSTLRPVVPPKYLKGSKAKRGYYLPGDIIGVKKSTKSQIESKAGLNITIDDDSPGVFKFIRYLMNDGNPKLYTYGFLILKIMPNGDGTGIMEVQPVIFRGGYPIPVSFPRLKGVASSGVYGSGNLNDLNQMWHLERNYDGDLNALIIPFVTFVAEFGVGTAKKLVAKGIKHAMGRYLKRKFKHEVTSRLTKGLAKGSVAFASAFANEIWLQLDKKERDFKDVMSNRNSLLIALEKGFASFLATVLKEAFAFGMEKLIPKDDLAGIGKRLAIAFLNMKIDFVVKMTTGLINRHASSLNSVTGESNDQLKQEAMKAYEGELTTVLVGMQNQVRDNLVDYAMGPFLSGS